MPKHDRLAVELWNANAKSVAFRYEEPPLLVETWDGGAVGQRDPVQLLKAIHCYEYQSCEPPDWDGSRVEKFCRRLESFAMRDVPGYNDAEWGIS